MSTINPGDLLWEDIKLQLHWIVFVIANSDKGSCYSMVIETSETNEFYLCWISEIYLRTNCITHV